MINYSIYQAISPMIATEWPYNPMTFSFGNYEEVYSGELPCDTDIEALDKVYKAFTFKPPVDFGGHPLVVGDLIKINDNWYYVQPYDFKLLKA